MKRPQSRRGRASALFTTLVGSTLGVGLLASAVVVAPSATASVASDVTAPAPPPDGHTPPAGMAYLEICKDFTLPTITENTTPNFTFNVGQGSGPAWPVQVTAGSNGYGCSAPFAVKPGNYTITEVPGTWYQVSSIQQPVGENYIVPGSINLPGGSVQVTVQAGNSATVGFVNDPVYGNVEVCKYPGPNDTAINGAYTFNLSGANGYSGTTTVQLPGCSRPVQVPAGPVTVTEAGTNLYVTNITAVYDGTTQSAIASGPNLQTGTVTVNVNATNANSGTGTQTDVNFYDDVVQFKVCKVWTGSSAPPSGVTTFPFTLSSSGPAGPTAVPATLSIPAGTMANPDCSPTIPLRAGTVVTVTENTTPGTKLISIQPSGAYSLPSTPDVVNRTISLVVGQPVTGATNPVNEAWVTFTNTAAAPDPMKICVKAGTPAPAGSSYGFTVSGNPGVTTTVSTGNCAFVNDPNGNQMLFPFMSSQTVTGKNVSPDGATGVTVNPAMVTESLGGTQVTNVPSIAGTDLSKPSVTVVMSEGGTNVTEVDFTIAGAGASTGGSGGSSSGGTSSGGTSSGGTSTGGTSTGTSTGGGTSTTATVTGGGSTPTVVSGNVLPQTPVSPSVTPPSTTGNGNTATPSVTSSTLLAKQAQLASVRAQIATTRASLVKAHARWHNAAVHHWKSTPTLLKIVQRLQARLRTLLTLQQNVMAEIASLS